MEKTYKGQKRTLEIIAGLLCTSVVIGGWESLFLPSQENSSNEKVMPQIQPWIYLTDENHGGDADNARLCYNGGVTGAIKLCYDRKPTQEEINWYKNN